MTPSEQRPGTAPHLPNAVMEMQQTIERLYLSEQSLRRQVSALRASHPVICHGLGRPSLVLRILMRLHGGFRRRYQVRILQGCGLFDARWYLRRYEDVRIAGVDPALHYLLYGAAEGRDPGPHFSTTHYMRLYPDISKSDLNPLWHYLVAGWRERRAIRPGMTHGEQA
ncbi:hypothetical protein KBY29_21660 [Ruegeria pomeroyi]|uniref:hypothetical protein n=1 Tax=Ruegeria pomeroyi TaxID=89184 RepID=UPI001F45083A|nr:hypothetical protein [Ruegeria pomeroyi]MCE8509980.1 hypothetical protein [Ruegeria pomeroyi]MCE8556924.1 hypothetical protein [Ruegeria pomeroyi]